MEITKHYPLVPTRLQGFVFYTLRVSPSFEDHLEASKNTWIESALPPTRKARRGWNHSLDSWILIGQSIPPPRSPGGCPYGQGPLLSL